jgi:hypothetical protein
MASVVVVAVVLCVASLSDGDCVSVVRLLLATFALVAWSAAGERLPGTPVNAHYTFSLLVVSAVLRMLAQRLRVEAIATATLALDAYAVAVMSGAHHRQQGLSPKRSAWLLLASLPLERALQTLIGDTLLRAPVAGFGVNVPSRFPAP